LRRVFADSCYWIALFNRKDQHHTQAREATKELGTAQLVTSDGVFLEFLTYARRSTAFRQVAIQKVKALLDNANVETEPFTHRGFLEALDFFESRLDKEYSFVDCMSMTTMRKKDISEVLTTDRHFSQEGFTVLMG
jgi:predicted nucleic acid-binding protein